MGVNTVPISSRTLPLDGQTTANGSYTLPRYAFIPHASLQQLSGAFVASPTPGGAAIGATFAAPYQLQRPYPTPSTPNVYGTRAATVVNLKTSPAA